MLCLNKNNVQNSLSSNRKSTMQQMLYQCSVASLARSIEEKKHTENINSSTNLTDHLLDEFVQSAKPLRTRNLLNQVSGKVRQYATNSTQSGKVNDQYFNSVLISKLACLKLLQHSLRGGKFEVMGMLVGSTIENKFVVFDCYELPVEGTETRVNAQSESYEYMVKYMSEIVPETHNIVGWYHSHPGYDCWLSNIDMHTQDLNQSFQDPYLAVVVDPFKSLQQRKISLGAFRTFHLPSEIENEDPDSTLRFYNLSVQIFDSDYNRPLEFSKLDIGFPKFDLEADTVLLESLVGISKEWNILSERNIQASARVDVPKDFFVVEQRELNANHARKVAEQSQEIGIFQRPARSSSFISLDTSTNDNSDVEMDDQQLGDLESVDSSVHTITEHTSPYRRPTQLALPVPTSLTLNSQKEGSCDDREKKTEGRRNKALKTQFHILKDTLLNLKLEEYRQLRFFKDTFTLDNSP